ncbi:MAG: phosphopantothenoylcysteine decarboxylase [Bacteroidetes bacterium QS_8_68_15]|nr:MAG: phosphopantothenoylcysteine decarboxylase [Bacteroidetes bacterium QS_8_68_15]
MTDGASGGNAPERRDDALDGRKLLLGVSGGIAAYKTAALVRLFKKAGAEVQVLMTESAARFVTPLTLGALSGREVLTGVFPDGPGGSDEGESSSAWTKHISLGLWADLFVVAPATAQTLAKLSGGFCDSMLTATALSARCPLLVCPSMDRDMYAHPAVQGNLERLRGYGYTILPAAEGELASGLTGRGRLPEPEAIADRARSMVREEGGRSSSAKVGKREKVRGREGEGRKREGGKEADEPATPSPVENEPSNPPTLNPSRAQPLRGEHVLVTAGPTREPLDPVRHLTNPSTGTMGFALAEAAARRGAHVTLVAGPTALETPAAASSEGGPVERIDVNTAAEMHAAAREHAPRAGLVVMAAAVADYTPAEPPAPSKLKKGDTGDELTLRLTRTPDILAELGAAKRDGQRLVGFALETDDGPDNARRKLREKNLDWIVLNSLTEDGSSFGPGANRVTLIGASGTEEDFPTLPKRALADRLLDRVAPTAASRAETQSQHE